MIGVVGKGIAVTSAADSNVGSGDSFAAALHEVGVVGVEEGIPVETERADHMMTESSQVAGWDLAPRTFEERVEVAERHAQCREEERGSEVVGGGEDWRLQCNNSGRPCLRRSILADISVTATGFVCEMYVEMRAKIKC